MNFLHGLLDLLILSLLELVLGVDNIIFISLAITKIPEERRFKTKVAALSLAFVMRIAILFCLVWLSHITAALFTVSGFEVSIKDILFFIGGVYLTFNTIKELARHHQIIKSSNQQIIHKSVILEIAVVDLLFSFDSIFTAIGLVPNFIIMALAVAIGMIFMIYFSGKTANFIEKNSTIKTLALCFIILVGISLITQAFHFEIPKGYFYFMLALALVVEEINRRIKR